MKNFDWTSFKKRIAIKANLPDLYEAWATKAGLESWFLEEVSISRNGTLLDKHISAIPGDQYSWKWFLYEDPMPGEFKQTNGKDFLQFTFEGTCLVDIFLEQRGEYVLLTLTHHNIPTDDSSKQFIRLGCTNGWTFYLTNLKSVYEGGLDLRNKVEDLGTMINN